MTGRKEWTGARVFRQQLKEFKPQRRNAPGNGFGKSGCLPPLPSKIDLREQTFPGVVRRTRARRSALWARGRHQRQNHRQIAVVFDAAMIRRGYIWRQHDVTDSIAALIGGCVWMQLNRVWATRLGSRGARLVLLASNSVNPARSVSLHPTCSSVRNTRSRRGST